MSRALELYLEEIEGENLVIEENFEVNLIEKDFIEKCGYTAYEARKATIELIESECL